MALVLKDRVKVNSTTAGTGTFTLGSAVNGFQGFSVIGDGNTTYYTITDYNGNWEVGYGTYTASGTTLSRTTILESSNSGSVVDFPAGDKVVFVTYPAEKSVALDDSGNATLTGVFTPAGGIANGALFNKTGSGAEGGELHLEKGATSTLSGDAVIDLYGQSIRIFDNSGTNKGAKLDISAQAAGVGSDILTTASTVGISNGGTGATSAATALSNLGALPVAGGSMTGGFKEAKTALAANDIDISLGNYFTKTISTTTTLTVSNVPSTGTAATFVLDLTNGGSATITWWSGMKWAGGTAPTLTASGRDSLGFYTYDGGTTWSGLVLGKDLK